MKKCAIYARVSTADQRVETQLYDLRKLAAQRGFEVVKEYCDQGVSGSKDRRPGLDSMMVDARRGNFSLLLVAAFDRLGRGTVSFLKLVDGHDFNCSGGTKRIAHRFPHFTVGRFRISSRHGHKRILSGWHNLCALKALRPTVKLGTYVHIIYLGA